MKPMEIADPFARQLMARYLSHRQEDLAALKSAAEDGDYDTIRITAHNMYGSGSAYGLDRISEIGESLEAAAERRDRAAAERLITSLEDYVRTLIPA